jgi:hypothetical protein
MRLGGLIVLIERRKNCVAYRLSLAGETKHISEVNDEAVLVITDTGRDSCPVVIREHRE